VKEKWNLWLPIMLMALFALTRWPGLMPLNFSAAYALAFCAGVYFPRRVHWWLPLTTLAISDFALNCYYRFGLGIDAFQPYQLINYVVYVAIIWLGTKFNACDSWLRLVSGGIFGAIMFYLVTNTAAWFFNPFNNPEYTKNLSGWIIALTKGTAGWPEAWTFFRNTLLSGGLFTGLFAGVMKLTVSSDRDEQEEPAAEEGDASAEESKA